MNRRTPIARRGAAILIVLVVLLLLGVAMSLALRANLTARAEARRAAARLQAEYLATAGLELATAKLADDATYPGETWQAPAADLGGPDSAEVSIEVSNDASNPESRLITVLATYPADGDAWRQQRHRISFKWSSSIPFGRQTP